MPFNQRCDRTSLRSPPTRSSIASVIRTVDHRLDRALPSPTCPGPHYDVRGFGRWRFDARPRSRTRHFINILLLLLLLQTHVMITRPSKFPPPSWTDKFLSVIRVHLVSTSWRTCTNHNGNIIICAHIIRYCNVRHPSLMVDYPRRRGNITNAAEDHRRRFWIYPCETTRCSPRNKNEATVP